MSDRSPLAPGGAASLDLTAIGRGAAAATLVALPAAVVQNLADEHSSLRGLMLAVIVVGLGWGGAVAGRAVPDRALSHGALAALAAFVVVQGLGVVLRLARGETVHPLGIVFYALLSTSCGIVGAQIGARRRQHAAASDDGDTDTRHERGSEPDGDAGSDGGSGG